MQYYNIRAESQVYFLPATAGSTPPGLRVLLPVCHELTLIQPLRGKVGQFIAASGTNLMFTILFFPMLAPPCGLGVGVFTST